MSEEQETVDVQQTQEEPEVMDTSQQVTEEQAQVDVAPTQEVVPTETANGNGAQTDELKIFVGGLNWRTTKESLQEYFKDFGDVSDIELKKDPDGKSRGFAFVVFATKEALDKVLAPEKIGDHEIDGRKVDVKKAIPHAIHQAQKHRTKKIFVGGVPKDMGEETIREYFKNFGEIEEVALVNEKGTDKRREFIFVTFKEYETVDEITKITSHVINDKQVDVKRASPKEQSGGGQWGGARGRGGGYGRGRGGGRNMAPYGAYGGGGGSYGNYSGGNYGAEWGGYDNYGGYGGGAYSGGYSAGAYGGGGYGGGGYGGGGGGYGGAGGGYGGGSGGYGGGNYGGGGYGGYTGGGRGGQGQQSQGFGSRYGPMKSSYNNNSSYHPYSR